MNFDLLECLLLNASEPNYATYLKTFISQINETKNFDFVSKFYDTGKAHQQLVTTINEQWSNFFLLALQGKHISAAQIRQFSIDTLYYSDPKIITAANTDSCLSDYISSSSDYLEIENPDIDKLISGFLLIEVSFSTIEYDKADKPLFYEVYRRCLYNLTFDNISLMLKKIFKTENDSDIIHKNFTLIQSHLDSQLAVYVSKNMPLYMDVVLENCNGDISDDETIAVKLLNNTNVEATSKERYIRLLTTVISDITKITEASLWTLMMNQGIIAFSESNFTIYFQQNGIDAALIKYINDASKEINFKVIADNFKKETVEALFDAVAVCNNIATDKYRKILVDLGFYFDTFDVENITDEKFKVLIDERILQMDIDGLSFVREKYSKHLFAFIRRNLGEYLALQTAEVFKLNEALQVITWDIDDIRKTGLLAYTNEPLSVVEKRYSDAVNAHILLNNFKEDDKPFLYEKFTKYGEQTQDAIVMLAVAGVNEIISKNMGIEDALLSALFQADTVTRDQKLKLFVMVIPKLNENTCKIHFDDLGLSELNGIFTKGSGRRNYKKSNDVTVILDALKLHSWIYEYHDDERNSERYIIVKNKPRKEQETQGYT